MADRTVNVRINYIVNTAEIQRAQAASQAAQKATDDLRKATQAYGQAASQANKEATAAFKQVGDNSDKLLRQVNSLATTVRTLVQAGIVKWAVDTALEMATLAGKVEGVQRAFNRLPNATLLLNDLRKSTHGTVTDLELMQKALSASNFKIPLEKMGTLLEFAAVKAQQTGQEVNHLVNYIVSGIGYRSIKRLDDLGFTANRVKEALGGVSLQAASMGQVMDAITKLMNEDLAKTGGYVETSATAVERLKRNWEQLGVEVSKQGTSNGFIAMLDKAVKSLTVFAKADFDIAKIPMVLFLEKTSELATQQAEQFVKNNKLLKEGDRLGAVDKELFDLAKLMNLYAEQSTWDDERLVKLKKEIEALRYRNESALGFQRLGTEYAKQIKLNQQEIDSINNKKEALVNNRAVISETIRTLVEYRDAVVQAMNKDEEQLGIIEKKRAEIDSLQEQLEKSSKMGDLGSNGKLVLAIKKAQTELDILLGKAKDTGNEIRDFLGYLSDLEMFQTKEILSGRNANRKKELKDQEDFDKEFAGMVKHGRDKEKQEQQDLADDELAKRKAYASAGIDIVHDQVQSILNADVQMYDIRIQNLRDYYDTQINLAGDNERAKQKLRIQADKDIRVLEKERADREKKAAQAGILVNTALGIMKAFATAPTTAAAIIQAIIVAAEGASQYAIASRARYYAKGEIDIKGGQAGKDSIPAMLTPGESIMTSRQTREAFGILTDVRAGRLNDKVLKQIVASGGSQASFNDERIVNELKGIRKSQYSLERQGRQLYRVYSDNDGNKKRIRSSNTY